MPEADFAEAQIFAAGNLLPWRRIEIMLARVCAETATARGVKDVTVSDFMLKMETPDEDDSTPVTTEAARAALDFRPSGTRRKRSI